MSGVMYNQGVFWERVVDIDKGGRGAPGAAGKGEAQNVVVDVEVRVRGYLEVRE
jgi:hypothetical protein